MLDRTKVRDAILSSVEKFKVPLMNSENWLRSGLLVESENVSDSYSSFHVT